MEQFAPIKRSKDGLSVRYLIVDDSVFARKNLARMIETFGDRKSTRLNSSHRSLSRMPSSA